MAHHVRSWTTSLEARDPGVLAGDRVGFEAEVERGPRPREHVAEVRPVDHDLRPHLDPPARREVLEHRAPHAGSFLHDVDEAVAEEDAQGGLGRRHLLEDAVGHMRLEVGVADPAGVHGLGPAVVGVDPLCGTPARCPTAGGGCRRWPRRRPPRASPRARGWARRRSCARRGGRSGGRPPCRPSRRPRRGRRCRARPARERQERRPPGEGRRKERMVVPWKRLYMDMLIIPAKQHVKCGFSRA